MPFMDDDDDNQDPDEAAQRQQMDADRDALLARWEEADIEGKLRKLGVYVEGHPVQMPVPTMGGVKIVQALQAKTNRSAWTKRVLDPDADAMNKQFEVMATHATDDKFLDEREQILKNIAEGRDPLDNGDDSDL